MTDDLHEQRLIERIKKGDHSAFEILMNQYSKGLYNYILFRSKNEADAMDVLQDAMLSIWQSIVTYENQSSFKTWAFSITRRRLADFYRKNIKHNTLPLTDFENTLSMNDNFVENVERMDVNRALSHLNDKENELVYLIFQVQLSYQEISMMLNIPVGTIKSRMSNIKAKLKPLLN